MNWKAVTTIVCIICATVLYALGQSEAALVIIGIGVTTGAQQVATMSRKPPGDAPQA